MGGYWLNRTLCEVLAEMRKCNKTRNYGPLAGLIEEAQIMGNRMESALANVDDLAEMEARFHAQRRKLAELKRKIKLLEIKAEGLEGSTEEE